MCCEFDSVIKIKYYSKPIDIAQRIAEGCQIELLVY